MPILHALVLGVVQGLAEFLPISSSGHLEIVPWLLGWDDFAGRGDLERAFDVAVHLGTLAGAIAYFRVELWRYARAGLRVVTGATRRAGLDGAGPDERIAVLLVVSAVPAAIVGLLLADALEGPAENHTLIGVLLAVFGLVLLWADRLGGSREVGEWSTRDAVTMGVAQALALQPGVSRSGVTITAGRWAGLSRDAAARLSFLMSVPVIAGAGLLSIKEAADGGGIPSSLHAPVAVAVLASALTGYLAVWGTVTLVRTRTFTPFVIYRVVAGAGIVAVAVTGLR